MRERFVMPRNSSHSIATEPHQGPRIDSICLYALNDIRPPYARCGPSGRITPCSSPSTAATAAERRPRWSCSGQWLREQGRTVVACRDPGSTPLGEAVREVLLNRHDLPIHRRSEMLLYMAARRNWSRRSSGRPSSRAKTVVADRYLLANVVYQGHAGGLDVAALWEVGRVATGGLMPRADASCSTCRRKPRPHGSSGPWTAWSSKGPPSTPGCARVSWPRPPGCPEQIMVIDATGRSRRCRPRCGSGEDRN